MLDSQIQILCVDTGNFYSNRENYLHQLNHKIRVERNSLKKDLDFFEEYFYELGFDKKEIKKFQNGKFDEIEYIDGSTTELKDIFDYHRLYKIYKYKGLKAKNTKDRMLKILGNKVNVNIASNGKHHTRKLRFIDSNNKEHELTESNIISVFDSALTRMIGAKIDELSEDIMVIQVYYFDVVKDIIYNGFTYKGEKYIYFTSSAGQIRTKKVVFIKESVWNRYEKTIMCGLTLDKINEKGGNNPN